MVKSRRFEKRPVSHDGGIGVIHTQRQALCGYLFDVHVQRKTTYIVVSQTLGVLIHEPRKSVFLTMVKRRRLDMGPNTALSMDSD